MHDISRAGQAADMHGSSREGLVMQGSSSERQLHQCVAAAEKGLLLPACTHHHLACLQPHLPQTLLFCLISLPLSLCFHPYEHVSQGTAILTQGKKRAFTHKRLWKPRNQKLPTRSTSLHLDKDGLIPSSSVTFTSTFTGWPLCIRHPAMCLASQNTHSNVYFKRIHMAVCIAYIRHQLQHWKELLGCCCCCAGKKQQQVTQAQYKAKIAG
eukprot:365305-Chlamydomonas_euryale.AAC.11